MLLAANEREGGDESERGREREGESKRGEGDSVRERVKGVT